MDKETILKKYPIREAQFGSDTIAIEYVKQAMQEYADQQTKHLTEQLAEKEKDMPKWISVRDKMPPKIGSYICAKNNEFVTQLYYDCDLEFMYGQLNQTNQVTHWMPLPNKPTD